MKYIYLAFYLVFLSSCIEDSLKTPTRIDNLSVYMSSPDTYIIEDNRIIFEGGIHNPQDSDISNLALVLESNIDGVLYTGIVPSNGEVRIPVEELSRSVHIISLSIINETNERKTVSRILNYAIKLITVENGSNDVTLKWENYFPVKFTEYEVYKSRNQSMYDKEVVAKIQSAKDLVFKESHARIGEKYYYQVAGLSQDTIVYSTIQEVDAGVYITLDVPIQRFKYDSKRNRVYAISNLEYRSGHERPYYTAVIDLEPFEIVEKIDGIAYDIDIDDEFQYIYLASGTTLNKIDLESFTVTNLSLSKVSATELIVYRLEYIGNNKILFQLRDGCRYCTIDGLELGLMDTNGNLMYYSVCCFEYGNFIYDRLNKEVFLANEDFDSYYHRLLGVTNTGFTYSNDLSKINWERLSKIAVKAGELFPFNYAHITSSKPDYIIAYSPFSPLAVTTNAVYDLQKGTIIKKLPEYHFDEAFFIDAQTMLLVRREEKTDYDSEGLADRYIESKIFIYKL